MKHCNKALEVFKDTKVGNKNFLDFISIEDNELKIKVQDGVVPEVGINGIQVTNILEYINELYKSLNSEFPCRENSLTITKIEEAIHWQEARTKDRIKRNVEGKNEK